MASTTMSAKRKRDAVDADAATPEDGSSQKRSKAKHGFRVGPANLPDGPYKRKVQKIKTNLIEKARIRREYDKVRPLREAADQNDKFAPNMDNNEGARDNVRHASTTPHPDRQTLIDEGPQDAEDGVVAAPGPRQRRPKPAPFKREYEQAQRRKSEAEERRHAREEAERQRQQKREERERFQKAMAKARKGGRNGQRKLGRESIPLLEKVKRLVSEDR